MTGDWRRLHNEELHDLYCSPNIMRVIKSRRLTMEGHVARMRENRNAYRNRPLERPRRRWEDNINMYLKEIVSEDVDWIYLAQDRAKWRALVNAVMKLWIP